MACKASIPTAPFLALHDGLSNVQIAAICGTSKREVCRWKSGGFITRLRADQLAAAAGVDPADVWAPYCAGVDDLPDVRLPLGDALDWWTSDWDAAIAIRGAQLADVLRWRAEGTVTLDEADRIACARGLHPANLWGSAWYQAIDLEPA